MLRRLSQLSVVFWMAAAAGAQESPTPAQPPTVIKTETKLVLVDAVVSNKKGQYIDDLTIKDFRVWEDNKEQTLKTFSYGPDPKAPDGGKRYILLFFDSMSLSPQELAQSRTAAQRFIESNAGSDRMMAVAQFMGGLQIIQNFSPDIDKLKDALGKVRSSTIVRGPEVAVFGGGGPGAMGQGPRVDPSEDFAERAMLQGLRVLAKNLGEIPGRKSLIMFTSGFPLTNQGRDEATVTISACNRSNVAIYPVDARGLAGGIRGGGVSTRGRAAVEMPGPAHVDGLALAAWPVARIASVLLDPQVGAGRGGSGSGSTSGPGGGSPGGGGGGGARPGGSGGLGNPAAGSPAAGRPTMPGSNPGINNNGNNGRGNIGGGGVPNNNNNNNPMGRNGRNGPFGMEMPNGALDRQQIIYMLADGTGGFPILNTNDLIGGLEKIAKEQTAYYVLGYTPPDNPEGSCHTLKVKVDRGGANLRSRVGYCNAKSKDVLAGQPIEKTLETRVTGSSKGTIAASMSAPFFYTGANSARVAVTVDIPSDSIKFEKVKGKQHAALNVLGLAYTQDGSVAARFSDVVKLDFENAKDVDKFKEAPLHYENQFDIAAGSYSFKLVFDSGGENFGKLEAGLAINTYDAKQFAISSVALCRDFTLADSTASSIDSLLLEGRSPLIAGAANRKFKFNPAGTSRFAKSETPGMYFEIYDPKLTGDAPPKVTVQMRLLDAKTGAAVTDSGVMAVDTFINPGDSKVPTGLKLPVSMLPPGSYRVEIKAQDSSGDWATRAADFEVM